MQAARSVWLLTILAAAFVAAAASACSTASAPPDNGPVQLPQSSPGPLIMPTPVPLIKAHAVAEAGRTDPFVVLFGPPESSSSSNNKPIVSKFPKIPTLPGFEGPPNAAGELQGVWSGVRVTGILQAGGYTAIIEAGGKSYVAHTGDYIAGQYRVLAIGPHTVTLAANKERRNFTLGG